MRSDSGPDSSRMANITCRREGRQQRFSFIPESRGQRDRKVRLSLRSEERGQDVGVEGEELSGGRNAAHTQFEHSRSYEGGEGTPKLLKRPKYCAQFLTFSGTSLSSSDSSVSVSPSTPGSPKCSALSRVLSRMEATTTRTSLTLHSSRQILRGGGGGATRVLHQPLARLAALGQQHLHRGHPLLRVHPVGHSGAVMSVVTTAVTRREPGAHQDSPLSGGGVNVGVKEEVHRQLKTLFGHGLMLAGIFSTNRPFFSPLRTRRVRRVSRSLLALGGRGDDWGETSGDEGAELENKRHT
ncbi:hypothetical protein EYF80_045591 [Liparis tanakae]|uniref:Uncharacterized protein n=1 Tax=Liparis tanakae TaxID=230148 RepID=A0A4Z2FSN5_9TELE|nr:hypothetical protein EYF80_045591 [Liparis tanakae]